MACLHEFLDDDGLSLFQETVQQVIHRMASSSDYESIGLLSDWAKEQLTGKAGESSSASEAQPQVSDSRITKAKCAEILYAVCQEKNDQWLRLINVSTKLHVKPAFIDYCRRNDSLDLRDLTWVDRFREALYESPLFEKLKTKSPYRRYLGITNAQHQVHLPLSFPFDNSWPKSNGHTSRTILPI